MNLILRKNLILIILALFLLIPQAVLSFELELELDYPKVPGTDMTLNDIAAGPTENQLGGIVQYIYYFIVSIAGLATFVMLVWGGVSYLTSAGNPSMISDARDRMFKAVLGLVIILASYLILDTLSPELVLLKTPGVETAEGGPGVPEVTPHGSSGDPIAGSECLGPNSYEDSGNSLEELAVLICDENGQTPVPRIIHNYLTEIVGPTGCNSNDVALIEFLLGPCGPAPGDTVDGITIDYSTVPAYLCEYIPLHLGTEGMIYSSRIVGYAIEIPGGALPGTKETAYEGNLLEYINENVSDFAEYCAEEENENRQYCFLQDRTTRINSLNQEQLDALAQYCYDIIP